MRKVADCRLMPSEGGCTLTISGEEDEVLSAATEHAVSAHGHSATPELSGQIASMLAAEGSDSEFLRGGYEAYARQDLNDVLSRFTDDVVWTEPATLPFGGTYQGPKAVAGMFGRLSEHFATVDVRPEAMIEQGGTVVVTGKHRHRTVGGRDLDLPFVHVWTMRDGKACAFEEFVDTAALNAALGTGADAGLDAGSRTGAQASGSSGGRS